MSYANRLFSLLDDWRHFPSYQLERRADIFFATYLPEIVKRYLKFEVGAVIPEFPVRIGSIDSQSDSNRSFKVDYLVKAKGKNKVALIELKTDMSSKRKKQEEYLKAAKRVGIVKLLKGLRPILSATSQKRKYQALINELAEAGFLHLSDQHAFEIVKEDYVVEIACIQPKQETLSYATVISFDQVAALVRKKRDGFGKRFAASLDIWSKIEPGSR